MVSPEISRAALERLLQPLTGDRVVVVVIYRRYDDYGAFERELSDLNQKYKRAQDDV